MIYGRPTETEQEETSMNTCPLHTTKEQYEEIKKVEAVILYEYELSDGSRTAELINWGSFAEMTDANAPSLVVIPNDVTVIGQRVLYVKELLPPDETK